MSDIDLKLSVLAGADFPPVGNEWVIIIQGGVTKRTPLNTLNLLGGFYEAIMPLPTPAARVIYVLDEIDGAVPAFSDGFNWRRVTDREIVRVRRLVAAGAGSMQANAVWGVKGIAAIRAGVGTLRVSTRMGRAASATYAGAGNMSVNATVV